MWDRLDRSIRVRVRIYAVIVVLTAVISVVDTVRIGARAVLPVLVTAVVGVALGMVVSRMFALSWDEISGTVVGRIDLVGGVILVGYLLLSVFRSTIVDIWLDGPLVGAAAVALLGGLMLGQILGTRRGIRRLVGLLLRGRAAPGAA